MLDESRPWYIEAGKNISHHIFGVDVGDSDALALHLLADVMIGKVDMLAVAIYRVVAL